MPNLMTARQGRADEAEIRVLVERYVDQLKAAGAIGSAAVERAFRTVGRHRLLETDFLFFLGLHDRRACHAPLGPALSDGPDGWAALAPDGIRWWKDESLARELDRCYREWDARGRPTIRDYTISFVPAGQETEPPPGGWQIERRFYRQLLTLG